MTQGSWVQVSGYVHVYVCARARFSYILLNQILSGRNWKIMSSGVVDDLDEGTGDKSSEAKIGDVLGTERRDVLISAVYMLRSDVNTSVCQASYQVRSLQFFLTPMAAI